MMNARLFAVVFCFSTVLAAAPSEDGFLTDWLVSGPYPSYQKDGRGTALDTDFLNGEADFVPYPGEKGKAEFIADWGKLVAGVGSTNEWGFRETKTFDTTWNVKSFPGFKVVLDKMFLPIDDYFAAYAVCWIESPDRRKILLGVGSDDDHKLYLNGKLIGRHYGSQGTTPDQFQYAAELQPDLNRLVFKLVDRTGGADFCVRLTGPDRKPMDGLKFYTDHPGRKYRAELYQNGYAGNLSFRSEHLYSGPQQLTVSVFPPDREPYSLRLNGKTVMPGSIPLDLHDGDNLLSLEVVKDGKVAAVLQKTVTAYSQDSLRKENAALQQEIRKNAGLLAAMRAKQRTLQTKLDAILKEREKVYADVERKYAEQRASVCQNAKKSADLPLTPATVRSRLCINGPWEASPDRRNWSEYRLPARMYVSYFRNWFNPVKNAAPDNPYGEIIPLKGWEDFRLSPVTTSDRTWFRKDFTFDGKTAATLVCGAVNGKLQVFVNGKKCGDYRGWMGEIQFPLTGLKPGENTLELFWERDPLGNHANMTSGILGDLYLDFTSPVKMSDVWVKPGWRQAKLSLKSEIENRTGEEQRVTVKQYAARDGRIKLEFPAVEKVLPPHQTVSFENAETWADPKCWGIGGKYGDPDLYDLVSDVYRDGKLIDRYVQPFGFREFWIHGTDFYLNGKRIILQGDLGVSTIGIAKFRDVLWPLLRHDGINTFRYHDSCAQWSEEMANTADRAGMLSYVQMYPVLFPGNVEPKPGPVPSVSEWTKTPEHQYNLENYQRWFRLFRNHPSAVIWSTDNEILTQAWDTAAKADRNVRNDKIGALYEKFMKTLDPDLVMTRNGDVGTWGHTGRWTENPPCDTANYHYPEYNLQERIVNWQKTYDYRPLILGETMYCAYFQKGGAYPELVEKRAADIRKNAGLYRKLEVPAQIFMGLSLDGFLVLDDSGKGNPWGITRSMTDRYGQDETVPPVMKPDQYPWFRISWPAQSGKGCRAPAAETRLGVWGCMGVNWFDPSKPSHVRSAVNDAYRDTLIPQPPLPPPDTGECVILTKPDAAVWSTAADGTRCGVRADREGKAWFQLPKPGEYTFEADGVRKTIDVPSRKSYAATPGFDQIKTFQLK